MRKVLIACILGRPFEDLAVATAAEPEKRVGGVLPFQLVVAEFKVNAVIEAVFHAIFETFVDTAFAATSDESSRFFEGVGCAHHNFRLVAIVGHLGGPSYSSLEGHILQCGHLFFHFWTLYLRVFFGGEARRHLFTCVFAFHDEGRAFLYFVEGSKSLDMGF